MLADKNSAMWKFSPTLDDVDGRTAFECSKAGDRSANAVVDYFVKYLGEGMLNFANIFRPQAIILGGGVCAQGDYLIYKLKDYCKDRNCRHAAVRYSCRPARQRRGYYRRGRTYLLDGSNQLKILIKH